MDLKKRRGEKIQVSGYVGPEQRAIIDQLNADGWSIMSVVGAAIEKGLPLVEREIADQETARTGKSALQ